MIKITPALSLVLTLTALTTACNGPDASLAGAAGPDNVRMESALHLEQEFEAEYVTPQQSSSLDIAALVATRDDILVEMGRNRQLGECVVSDHLHNPNTFCDFYVFSAEVGSLGLKGYPKNPASGDSTGCVVAPTYPKGVSTCWGGYADNMCSQDFFQNAANQLRQALVNGACEAIAPPPVVTQ